MVSYPKDSPWTAHTNKDATLPSQHGLAAGLHVPGEALGRICIYPLEHVLMIPDRHLVVPRTSVQPHPQNKKQNAKNYQANETPRNGDLCKTTYCSDGEGLSKQRLGKGETFDFTHIEECRDIFQAPALEDERVSILPAQPLEKGVSTHRAWLRSTVQYVHPLSSHVDRIFSYTHAAPFLKSCFLYSFDEHSYHTASTNINARSEASTCYMYTTITETNSGPTWVLTTAVFHFLSPSGVHQEARSEHCDLPVLGNRQKGPACGTLFMAVKEHTTSMRVTIPRRLVRPRPLEHPEMTSNKGLVVHFCQIDSWQKFDHLTIVVDTLR